jgi:hypothetical protein
MLYLRHQIDILTNIYKNKTSMKNINTIIFICLLVTLFISSKRIYAEETLIVNAQSNSGGIRKMVNQTTGEINYAFWTWFTCGRYLDSSTLDGKIIRNFDIAGLKFIYSIPAGVIINSAKLSGDNLHSYVNGSNQNLSYGTDRSVNIKCRDFPQEALNNAWNTIKNTTTLTTFSYEEGQSSNFEISNDALKNAINSNQNGINLFLEHQLETTVGMQFYNPKLVIKYSVIPTPPVNLSPSLITNNSCRITWTKPTLYTPSYYKVYINGIYKANTPSLLFDIVNLEGGKEYLVSVAAVNELGESNPSNGIRFLTKPNIPTSATVLDYTNSSCTISWTSPGGVVDGYCIYDIKDNMRLLSVATSTIIKLDKLNPGDIYNFGVKAYNSSGESGINSDIEIQIPLKPAPPTNPQIREYGVGHFVFSWSSSQSNGVLGYKIDRVLPNNGTLNASVTGSAFYVTPYLSPNAINIFRVRAYDQWGDSDGVTAGMGYYSSMKSISLLNEDLAEVKIKYNIEGEIDLIYEMPNLDTKDVDIRFMTNDQLVQYNVRVLDLQGRVVLDFNRGSISEDISTLRHSLYVVQIQHNGQIASERLFLGEK